MILKKTKLFVRIKKYLKNVEEGTWTEKSNVIGTKLDYFPTNIVSNKRTKSFIYPDLLLPAIPYY